MRDVLGIILAGGAGERLKPLTATRAKPAVPFGGKYRIVDFVLNNFINSGFKNVKVLVQSLSQPLINHINKVWPPVPAYNYFIESIPAQKRVGEDWYKSTADAVYQNLDIFLENPQYKRAAVFSGDHVYKMDIRQLCHYHRENGADFTISAMMIRSESASQFGILEVDGQSRVIGFEEKPSRPREIPGKPDYCLTSMGNYIANIRVLTEVLQQDAKNEESSHDFAKDVIPLMLAKGLRVFAYDYSANKVPGEEKVYWRDVGTIRSYWEANMELVSITPELNLYNELWPVRTSPDFSPPVKFSLMQSLVDNSIISGGSVVTRAEISNSVLGKRVRVEKGVSIRESVIFGGVTIGEGAKIFRTIIDRNVNVPPFIQLGFSAGQDEARGLSVSDGITVVPKGHVFDV